MSKCTKCGLELIKDDNWTPSMYQNSKRTCKYCIKKHNHRYYKNHKDAILKRNANYRKSHLLETSVRYKEYYNKHKDAITKYQINYWKLHPLQRKAISDRYFRKHKDAMMKYRTNYWKSHRVQGRLSCKRYYRRHKEEIKERNHNYRKNNPEKIKAYKTKYYRGLGFNMIVENDWPVPVHWHHVNDNDVVPIPRELHLMCYTGDRKRHRDMANRLIEILYKGELTMIENNNEVKFEVI